MSKVEQRPVIGIVPTQVPDEDIVRVNDHYTKAVIASGAAPLVLPISSDLSVYESIFPLLNGFILTGGQDIDPARYGALQLTRSSLTSRRSVRRSSASF